MAKIIDFFGKIDGGGMVLDMELHHKRMTNFIPFELDDYHKVTAFIDEKYPELFGLKRLEMIDKLLFPNQ